MSARRMTRHAMTEIATWIEVLAPAATDAEWEMVMLPRYVEAREEVKLNQQGICAACGREGRLLLATRDDGSYVGYCVDDHAAWVADERRST